MNYNLVILPHIHGRQCKRVNQPEMDRDLGMNSSSNYRIFKVTILKWTIHWFPTTGLHIQDTAMNVWYTKSSKVHACKTLRYNVFELEADMWSKMIILNVGKTLSIMGPKDTSVAWCDLTGTYKTPGRSLRGHFLILSTHYSVLNLSTSRTEHYAGLLGSLSSVQTEYGWFLRRTLIDSIWLDLWLTM